VTFPGTVNKVFMVVASKGEQRGYLKMDDGSSLSVSELDVNGQAVDKGTHTGGLPVGPYLITEKLPLAEFVSRFARTIYRPGTDMIYANWGFDAFMS
jgi:hypothetical protein